MIKVQGGSTNYECLREYLFPIIVCYGSISTWMTADIEIFFPGITNFVFGIGEILPIGK